MTITELENETATLVPERETMFLNFVFASQTAVAVNSASRGVLVAPFGQNAIATNAIVVL
jgi:hypothetical protein